MVTGVLLVGDERRGFQILIRGRWGFFLVQGLIFDRREALESEAVLFLKVRQISKCLEKIRRREGLQLEIMGKVTGLINGE